MPIGYLYDHAFLNHHQLGHPENRDRLQAIHDRVNQSAILGRLISIPFVEATYEQITQVHTPEYAQGLRQYSAQGGGWLDPSTYVMGATFKTAALAVGASLAAVNAVLAGAVQRAFALVRPPGHHAHANHAEGFCFFNNVAFSAKSALGDITEEPHARFTRVMIIDWDVHHGNGTESIFYDDPRVLYVSLHQHPLYPSSGDMESVGAGAGVGYNVNIPLPPGVSDRGYWCVIDEIVIPLMLRYAPQLVLVSAGYDAHWREPLANMAMSLEGFNGMVSRLVACSQSVCDGRMVFLLEGGYDLDVLSYGVLNTFYILNDEPDRVSDPIGKMDTLEAPIDAVLRRVKRIHNL